MKTNDRVFWRRIIDTEHSNRGTPLKKKILSGRRVDVYHATHDVVLVRIWNVGLKCAARGSLKMTQKFAICAPSHKFVGLYLRNEGMYRQS